MRWPPYKCDSSIIILARFALKVSIKSKVITVDAGC